MKAMYASMKETGFGANVDPDIFVPYLEKLFVKHVSEYQEVDSCELDSRELMREFTNGELEYAFKSMNSKGKSCNGYSPKELKELQEYAKIPLTDIFNDTLKTGEFPSFWLTAKVVFIHKEGNWKDPGNFRSINVQDACLKLFNKCMSNRLDVFLEKNSIPHKSQFAYRKGLGTLAPTLILHELARTVIKAKKGRKLYTYFVDFSKAFDGINRDKLRQKLLNAGAPLMFVNLVLHTFDNTVLRVGTNDAYVGNVKTNTGILQGSPLSSLLFNCFIADLAKEFQDFVPTLQEKRIPCISYADDIVLFAESPKEMKMMLKKLEDYCNQNDLKINTKKTKIMIFRAGGGYTRDDVFEINGNNIEIVNKFKYLGTFFTPRLSFSLQAEYLITKARSKIGLLFARTPIKEVSLDLALKLFQCYVTPILEFNMVIWTSDFKEALNGTINSIFTKFSYKFN